MEIIKPYVDEFYRFALEHLEFKFQFTRIGCGITGFTPEEIAPLFISAIELNNVVLPQRLRRDYPREEKLDGRI